MMYIIGITGTSGSGKSAASKITAEKGGYVIDADSIAHEIILKGNAAYDDIKEFFGESILDDTGEINRKKLGEKVFNDKELLKRLNEITHKHITEKIKNIVERESKCDHKCIVIDAPLLIETGLNKICQSVWLVQADKELQKKRIAKRDMITEELAQSRLDKQSKPAELAEFADEIINNNGSLEDMRKQVISCFNKIIRE